MRDLATIVVVVVVVIVVVVVVVSVHVDDDSLTASRMVRSEEAAGGHGDECSEWKELANDHVSRLCKGEADYRRSI